MIIEKATSLGNDALENPGKYKGFLGISIRNKFFSKKTLKEYFIWASSQFKEFTILLMDDPDKYNLKIFKNLSDIEALEKARDIAETLVIGYKKNLEILKIKNITILQFKNFKNDPKYINILESINEYGKINPAFMKSLYDLMDTNIGKKIAEFFNEKKTPEKERETVKATLLQYIIEELASIIYLTKNDYLIEVDPTDEFVTKKKLFEKEFQGYEEFFTLGDRGHIYVYPEGTSYYKKTYEE